MFEDHYTFYELESERKQAGKPIRTAYMPLASSPEIQYEMLKKLKLDGRTDEERMLEDLKLEEEKQEQVVLNIQADGQDGVFSRPQVQLIINNQRNIAPKQNLAKPEKSIQIMQQRGMAGLGTKTVAKPKATTTTKTISTVGRGGGIVKPTIKKQ